ncbi:MAG: GNAT family N-acetyltransferase [Aristaeellaceae bacterium]
MPKLVGRGVTLRPYRQEDAEQIAAWANDPETTRYLSGIFDLPYTSRNAEDFVAHVMAGSPDKAAFIIADAETEQYLGQIDLMGIDRRNRSATLGIVIARSEHRGRGVGREAIRLICRYGFRTLGLNRIQLEVAADNLRGQRCYAACGFQLEGVRRQADWHDGAFRDMQMMSLLREDFETM